MRKTGGIKLGISLLVMLFLAIHCADPNLPKFQFLSPVQNAVIVEGNLPYALDVEVAVAQPGCGATTYPIDPSTFQATLQGLTDGEVVLEQDVTGDFGEGILDPQTGRYTWSGTVDLPDNGEYRIVFLVTNDIGQGTGILNLRLEVPAADFPGGTFLMSVSNMAQAPASCFINQGLIGIILGLVQNITFPLDLPSGAEILASGNSYPITINLPFPLSPVDVLLSLDEPNNDILMDGPDDYTLDFSGLVPLPGFDCIITAGADGVFDDLDPDDLDGFLTIGITNVQAAPGGTCSLSTPTGDCDLTVFMDAD